MHKWINILFDFDIEFWYFVENWKTYDVYVIIAVKSSRLAYWILLDLIPLTRVCPWSRCLTTSPTSKWLTTIARASSSQNWYVPLLMWFIINYKLALNPAISILNRLFVNRVLSVFVDLFKLNPIDFNISISVSKFNSFNINIKY